MERGQLVGCQKYWCSYIWTSVCLDSWDDAIQGNSWLSVASWQWGVRGGGSLLPEYQVHTGIGGGGMLAGKMPHGPISGCRFWGFTVMLQLQLGLQDVTRKNASIKNCMSLLISSCPFWNMVWQVKRMSRSLNTWPLEVSLAVSVMTSFATKHKHHIRVKN